MGQILLVLLVKSRNCSNLSRTKTLRIQYHVTSLISTSPGNSFPNVHLTLEVYSDDNIEALTPGHFLIGRPLESLPDTSTPNDPRSLLKHWKKRQSLVKHFWKRWSAEYITHIGRFTKWKEPTIGTCKSAI